MNVNIAELIEILIAAGWRRRRLIFIPILVFMALGAVAVVAWPRMYTSRTLLMLQERQAADPLSSGSGATREGRLKADEIDTLLKSDRVLASAILDFNLGKKPLTDRQLENEIKDLKRQISVGVVGSEFIEIELKQSDRVGLGERLSIVLTRFFERLLSREDSMKTARQFALEQRARDLDVSTKALNDWVDRQAAATGATAQDENAAAVAELRSKQAAARAKLIETASAIMPGPLDPTNIALTLAAEQRFASVRLQPGLLPAQASPQRGVQLKDVEAHLDAYQTISAELARAQLGRARAVAQKLRETQSAATADAYREWQSLNARFEEAMAQHETHQQRAKKASGPSSTPFGLIAPESIRIIDEPRDPVSPTTSVLKILIACIGAGIGLGVGLAALAEQFDDHIYDSRGLEKLTGVAAVIRLPALDDESMALGGEPPGKLQTRRRLAVVADR